MTGQQTKAAKQVTIAIAGDRADKGRLLMAGLGEEIRGLWDTLSRVEAAPVPGGRLDLSTHSMFEVLNWLRRALTTIRSLDHEVFLKSDEAAYETVRSSDPRGLTVRGLTAPRNNAVHHPDVVDPGVDRAMGPFENGRYLIFPVWVRRTARLDPMFTKPDGKLSNSYATAYDDHVAGRSLHDPLMDAFDFFDALAPGLARRDADGQLHCFPLAPPPIAEGGRYFRLMPSSPNEAKQQALLDTQLRWQLEMSAPGGIERIITGAFETDEGELVLTGFTTVNDLHSYLFYDRPAQVKLDMTGGYRYRLSVGGRSSSEDDGAVEVARDLTVRDGEPLPIAGLLAAGEDRVDISNGHWALCKDDARFYQSFHQPG